MKGEEQKQNENVKNKQQNNNKITTTIARVLKKHPKSIRSVKLDM